VSAQDRNRRTGHMSVLRIGQLKLTLIN